MVKMPATPTGKPTTTVIAIAMTAKGVGEVSLGLIVVATCIYVTGLVVNFVNPLGIMDIVWVKYAIFVIPYLMVGLPVLVGAARGIARRELLDEQFLMAVATIAAFAIGEAAEAVAVMLFYQVGEGPRTRRSTIRASRFHRSSRSRQPMRTSRRRAPSNASIPRTSRWAISSSSPRASVFHSTASS